MPISLEKRRLHPEGPYYATIKGVCKVYISESRTGLLWTFGTGAEDNDGNELNVEYLTGIVLSDNSKLTKLIEAATGKSSRKLSDQLDAEFIIDKLIRIDVAHEKRDDGSIGGKIQGIFPIPPKPKPGPVPTTLLPITDDTDI